MATYIRLYSVGADFKRERTENRCRGGARLGALGTPEPVKAKAHALLKNLAAGLKIFGAGFSAYRRASVERPGVMVGEIERVSHLSCFNNYYGGVVQFRSHPYATAPRGQRRREEGKKKMDTLSTRTSKLIGLAGAAVALAMFAAGCAGRDAAQRAQQAAQQAATSAQSAQTAANSAQQAAAAAQAAATRTQQAAAGAKTAADRAEEVAAKTEVPHHRMAHRRRAVHRRKAAAAPSEAPAAGGAGAGGEAAPAPAAPSTP
jgi:hypothetical protein